MLCDNCKLNKATYHSSYNVNGAISEQHLCAQCFSSQKNQKEVFFDTQNVASFFSGKNFEDDFIMQNNFKQSKSCQYCGSTFEDFTNTGLLKCAKCYDTFYDELLPYLKNMHQDVVHKGKQLVETVDGVSKEVRNLEYKLKQAVASENYELASKLKKQIIDLKNKNVQGGE